MSKTKHRHGFTLIELMITVAIVGILAAIALPSYQDSIRKSRRADAKSDLMGLANAQERYFTLNNQYCDGEACALTSIYTLNPQNADYYSFSTESLTATEFNLTAAPLGSQADDPCGELYLTQSGTRTTSTNADGCW